MIWLEEFFVKKRARGAERMILAGMKRAKNG